MGFSLGLGFTTVFTEGNVLACTTTFFNVVTVFFCFAFSLTLTIRPISDTFTFLSARAILLLALFSFNGEQSAFRLCFECSLGAICVVDFDLVLISLFVMADKMLWYVVFVEAMLIGVEVDC